MTPTAGGEASSDDVFTELAARLLEVPAAQVTVFGEAREGAWLPPASLMDALSRGEAVAVADARDDARCRDDAALRAHGVVALLAVPLFAPAPDPLAPLAVAPARRVIGALCVADRAPRRFDVREVRLLAELATTVAADLDRRARDDAAGGGALSRSRREVSRILAGITDAFVALDKAWRYTFVNERAAAIFGRRPEDLVGKHIWTEFPEGVGQPFHLAYERAAREGVPVELEAYYAPYDRWFENRIYPHEDGVSVLFHDVTERKRTELLARGVSEVLERISASAPLDECLDALTRTMDAQSPEVISSILLLDEDGVHVRHAAGPGLPEEFRRAIDGSSIGPCAGSCGTSAYRREPVMVADLAVDPLWDDYRHLALPHGLRACWSTPILAVDGAVLGTFAIYRREPGEPRPHHLQIIDRATHVARIAIEAARAREAARRSHERLDLVLRAADAGVWDLDLAAGRAFFSPRWRGLLDRDPPRAWSDVEALVHEDDRARARAAFDACVQGRAPGYRVTVRLLHADGRPRWFEARGLLVRDDQGRPARLVGSHVDVTALHELNELLLQAQRQEVVGRLAGAVAHDFNNLLSVVIGYADLIAARAPADAALRRDLDEIRGAGRRASALTRQLLTIGRRLPAQPRVLVLGAVLAGMQDMLARVVGEDVHLALDVAPSLGRVELDPAQLEQVVLNLVVNARDAMPRGGDLRLAATNVDLDPARPPRGARLPVQRAGAHVALEVSDTGVGMSPETLARLFEPFFSTKAPGKGTGLGMAIIERIVRDAGGCLAVESAPGAGASFRVCFPRVEAPPTTDPADATDGSGERAPARRGDETVLLVEDDEAIRRLMKRVLEHEGYRVLAVSGARAALAAAEGHAGPIDVVVTDVVLPDLRGDELVERLARARPALKALLVSGHEAPVDGLTFLQKPFSGQALLERLRATLDAKP